MSLEPYNSDENIKTSDHSEDIHKSNSNSSFNSSSASNNEKHHNQKDSLKNDTEDEDTEYTLPNIIPKKQFWFIRMFSRKKIPPIQDPNDRATYKLLTANYLSYITFWWMNSMMSIGFKRQLESEDLWKVEGDMEIQYSTELLEKNFDKRLNNFIAKCEKNGKNPQKIPSTVLLLALNDTFKVRFWKSGAFKICSDIGTTLSPLLVRALISFVEKQTEDPSRPYTRGAGYSLGIMFLLIFNSICMNHFFHYSMLTGALVKSTLTNIVYKKTFKLNLNSKNSYPNGKITGLMTNDLSRIDLAIGYFHFNWTFPVSLGISLTILIINLGPSALSGFAVIILLVGFAIFSTKIFTKQRKASNKYIDKRVQAIRELISNLKMIKFYSWEAPYSKIIQSYRTEESRIILRMQILKSVINATVLSAPILSSMVAFLVLYSTGRSLKSAEVFSSVSLFNILRQPLMLMPTALAYGSDALVALKRVSEFLTCEEEEDYLEFVDKLEDSDGKELSVSIENASFHWGTSAEENEENTANNEADFDNKELNNEPEEVPPVQQTISKQLTTSSSNSIKEKFPGLLDINLSIKRGEFVVVSGLIGSGKSSLLSAIAGQMNIEKGNVKLSSPNGDLIYCQYPWIQNSTIKSNILFGYNFDPQIYDSVVRSCALDIDFKMFDAGDLTEVGERGITLSGGQKARINLARAIYASQVVPKSQDIILLDDVLSAVDARVGKHIMDECINGLISEKTRILATHQLSLIGSADRIIFMNGAGGIDVGTYNELYTRNEAFVKLMEYSKEEGEEDEESNLLEDEEIEKEQVTEELAKKESINNKVSKSGKITQQESRATGSISFKVYAAYVKLGSGFFGYLMVPMFLLAFAICVFLQFFQSVWLSFWLERRFESITTAQYIGLYIMFCVMCFFGFVTMFGLITYTNNRAGYHLFNLSTKNMLKTPMSFMDTTPIGRILNRFTKDVDTLDNDNPEQLRLVLVSAGFILGVFVLSIAYMPWFALSIPPLGFIYINFVKYYQASALDIKRIESLNRSLSYSHFNESLNGLNTIKSFHAKKRFLNKNEKLLNLQNSASFMVFASQRWLSIRLDLLASAVAFIVNMLCISGQFHINASSAGLVMAYVIQLAGILSLFIRSLTQVETNMNSVERLYEYAYSLPEEKPFEIAETTPAPEWPQYGSIKFENASMSYREGLPLVLKNLSIDIRPGEKVGICGRTGAGKSTVMMALFRLNELSEGKIFIDDVDIGRIGLHNLRSKLSIIPQDPVLFQGTIRQNLDPFKQCEDLELWDALRRSWLVEAGDKIDNAHHTDRVQDGKISLHKFHLDQLVEDEGANFSLGERQLLALARALVRNSKILILDEATSSVDYETDSKIQSTIVNEFSHCTILCIAHRLKTILNYDRILVLDKGEVKEFDTPVNLFNVEDSIFRQMCDRSNIKEEDFVF